MKKTIRRLALMLLAAGFVQAASAQAGSRAFSVSDNKWVAFAQGNLQLVGDQWRIADNQYDMFGKEQFNGHRDMFGYGAYSIPDDGMGWYVLSNDEWSYLFQTPPVCNTLSSGSRFTMATIDGTYKGLIIFPDCYFHPSGTDFVAGLFDAPSDFLASVSLDGWLKMEEAGCVFLPAAGYCSFGQTWYGVGQSVCYSSSTATTSTYYDPYFTTDGIYLTEKSNLKTWTSVRLVRNVEQDPDGIKSVGEDASEAEMWYDLSGRRTERPSKGIYVTDGRKVIVR